VVGTLKTPEVPLVSHARTSDRRTFIKSSALAAGALSLPRSARAGGGTSASPKINVAVVGAGGMGRYAVEQAATENFVAICDVDDQRACKTYQEHPQVPRFKDFRVMLDKLHKQIDAVAISTPDHTHFAIAMAAMELGKHVFVQKPLAHNVWQVRTLQKAARRYGVVTQMGNQGHTFEGMRRIKEWVDAGVVGEVREVVTWTNRPNTPWFVPPESFPPPTDCAPSDLDWELWQGPVAAREYSAAYVPVRWRGWWDYGCGSLGDIGCHTFDAPFWALELGSPTRVEAFREPPPGEGFVPMNSVVTYQFPARGASPPVTLRWYEKGFEAPKPRRWDPAHPLAEEGGMYMEGSKETLYHAGMRPESPMLTPASRFMELKGELRGIEKLPPVGDGPIEEWLRAIKGDGPAPGSSFDYAAPLTELVLLGALAQRTGRPIEWNAEAMRVEGQPELDPLLKEPAREGWRYGE
jgi:predicted dehydrogenase